MSSRLTESFLRHVTQHPLSSELSQQLSQYAQSISISSAGKASAESLLQWTEGLIRRRPQEAAILIAEALALLHKHLPQHSDTHYLDFLWQLFQQVPTPTLIQRLNAALALPRLHGSPAQLWRAVAEQYLKLHQLKASTEALQRAFTAAFTSDTMPTFTHCTTRLKPPAQALSREALHFDLDVFDALNPWDQELGVDGKGPFCLVHFEALAVDARGYVYCLETHHRWLFCFNAQGDFVLGLREHDLADRAFLHPESFFQLNDVACSQEHFYVAGCQGKVYVYTLQGQPVRHLLAPPKVGEPLSVAALPDGRVFVVYQHSAQIHAFNAQGVYQGAFGSNTTLKELNKSYFCGLAALNDRVYLYDRQWVQAFEIPQAGAFLDSASLAPRTHWALASAPQTFDQTSDQSSDQTANMPRCGNGVSVDQERLWVADTVRHQVCTALLSASPSLQAKIAGLSPLAVPGLRLKLPNDVATDGQGGVYIANTGYAQVLHLNAQKKIRVLIEHPRFQTEVVSSSYSSTERKKVSS